MTLTKLLLIVSFGFVLYTLFHALFALLRRKNTENTHAVARALTWRIGLSLLIFAALLLACSAGLLTPHPIF